jgi:hypothetical protein
MTSRLKSDRGNLVVHPYSLREVLRVTGSTKFPDKGSERELSKPAGRSASEPGCSLEKHNGVADPFTDRGRPKHLS